MALQCSGCIDISDIRTELKGSGCYSLGNSAVRKLAGKPAGCIKASDLYCKSDVIPVRYLIVGGGGGGGQSDNVCATAGGGGAGGLLQGTFNAASGVFSVKVGAGGVGAIPNRGEAGWPGIGENSFLNGPAVALTAYGGGGGGYPEGPGDEGGSGGGGGGRVRQRGGTSAISGGTQGNPGGEGAGYVGENGVNDQYCGGGGGGGGAGGWGQDGWGTNGGRGGIGINSDITGTVVGYAGGGGAAGDGGSNGTSSHGGGSYPIGNLNATPNTGGGGGSIVTTYTNDPSGAGGSGVVILRFPTGTPYTATGTYTATTVGSDTVIRWTAGTGTMTF